MSAVKEPERITLVEGLKLLESHLPAEEARIRLRQAFVQKAIRQEPLFALPYDKADIDWTTGSVKIPRKRDRYCPTFSRAEFKVYFFKEELATKVPPPEEKTGELVTLKPGIWGVNVDLKEAWRRVMAWLGRRRGQ